MNEIIQQIENEQLKAEVPRKQPRHLYRPEEFQWSRC